MSFIHNKIKQILTEQKIWFEEDEHEPVYTSEQAAAVRGLPSAHAGVKAMILKTDSGKFLLALVPGDRKVDTKKIAQLEGVKKLELASAQEVERAAGVQIGSVAPFGLKTDLKTYLSSEILQNEFIFFNPGLHTRTIKMRAADLQKVLGNTIIF